MQTVSLSVIEYGVPRVGWYIQAIITSLRDDAIHRLCSYSHAGMLMELRFYHLFHEILSVAENDFQSGHNRFRDQTSSCVPLLYFALRSLFQLSESTTADGALFPRVTTSFHIDHDIDPSRRMKPVDIDLRAEMLLVQVRRQSASVTVPPLTCLNHFGLAPELIAFLRITTDMPRER